MRRPWLLAAAALLIAGAAAERSRRQSASCRDFAGRGGTCIPVQQCPGLFQLLRDGPPSSGTVSKLRASLCRRGDGPSQRLVCCASGPVATTSPPPEEHPNRGVVERGSQCGVAFTLRTGGVGPPPLGKFPWLAVLLYRQETGEVSVSCNGALISQQHVLTAASCVSGLPARIRLEGVRLGDHNLANDTDCGTHTSGLYMCNAPQQFGVAESFVHDEYNKPRLHNNIALLKLDRPVHEDPFVGKVCLPFGEARRHEYTNVSLTVAGFWAEKRLSPINHVLLETGLRVTSRQECSDFLQNARQELGDGQFCAGGRRQTGTCIGASGSPFMTETPNGPPYSLVGMASFGTVSCGSEDLEVATLVSHYLNWILDRVGQ